MGGHQPGATRGIPECLWPGPGEAPAVIAITSRDETHPEGKAVRRFTAVGGPPAKNGVYVSKWLTKLEEYSNTLWQVGMTEVPASASTGEPYWATARSFHLLTEGLSAVCAGQGVVGNCVALEALHREVPAATAHTGARRGPAFSAQVRGPCPPQPRPDILAPRALAACQEGTEASLSPPCPSHTRHVTTWSQRAGALGVLEVERGFSQVEQGCTGRPWGSGLCHHPQD